jgi:hypothetical protein
MVEFIPDSNKCKKIKEESELVFIKLNNLPIYSFVSSVKESVLEIMFPTFSTEECN